MIPCPDCILQTSKKASHCSKTRKTCKTRKSVYS
nr:MAG TPA: NlpE N-terminal domain [Caudoviricetes sp.]